MNTEEFRKRANF